MFCSRDWRSSSENVTSVYEASENYQREGIPLIVLAAALPVASVHADPAEYGFKSAGASLTTQEAEHTTEDFFQVAAACEIRCPGRNGVHP